MVTPCNLSTRRAACDCSFPLPTPYPLYQGLPPPLAPQNQQNQRPELSPSLNTTRSEAEEWSGEERHLVDVKGSCLCK